jgi:hypothetical protein
VIRAARTFAIRLGRVMLWTNLTLPVVLFGRESVAKARLERSSLFHPASIASDSIRHDARVYAIHRRALIDSLLPNGYAGTVVTHADAIGGMAGVAWMDLSAIGLAAGHLSERILSGGGMLGELVEMHERGHLLQSNRPELVRDLLRRLPPPLPGSYAATSGTEHFAEMTSEAYRFVVMNEEFFSPVKLPDEQLMDAERDTPGTAGFVVYMLERFEAEDAEQQRRLLGTARMLRGDPRPWEPIYAALDAQRQADGTLRAWPKPSWAATMRDVDGHLMVDGNIWSRVVAFLILPSTLLARLISAF